MSSCLWEFFLILFHTWNAKYRVFLIFPPVLRINLYVLKFLRLSLLAALQDFWLTGREVNKYNKISFRKVLKIKKLVISH